MAKAAAKAAAKAKAKERGHNKLTRQCQRWWWFGTRSCQAQACVCSKCSYLPFFHYLSNAQLLNPLVHLPLSHWHPNSHPKLTLNGHSAVPVGHCDFDSISCLLSASIWTWTRSGYVWHFDCAFAYFGLRNRFRCWCWCRRRCWCWFWLWFPFGTTFIVYLFVARHCYVCQAQLQAVHWEKQIGNKIYQLLFNKNYVVYLFLLL